MATSKQQQAKAVYELWEVITQHRWRFVLTAFTVSGLVLLASLFLPRKYEAIAHFERRNAPELIEAIRSGASDSYMDPIPSLIKEIAGSHAIAQVVNDLEPRLTRIGYLNGRAEVLDLRQRVKQHLLVHSEYGDSTRIQLRLELILDDPNVASLVVNGLIDRYIQTTREEMVARANSSIQYYDTLILEHEAELEEHETRLGEFEQQNALLLPNQPFSIQAQLGEARDQLAMLNTELEGIDIRRRSLRDVLATEPATLPSVVHSKNPELIRLQRKLDELNDVIRVHVKEKHMTEQHPELIALRQEQAELAAKMDSLEQNVVTSTQTHPNPKRAELELSLNTADAERDALKEQISLRRKKIDELSAKATGMLPVRAEHRKLLAATETSQKDVDYYQAMRRRAANYLTPETGDRGVQLEFLRRAEPTRQPISPSVFQVILVAGFMGVSAGAMSVFLAHRTDESYRNASQLSETSAIPVLGSVSELITRQHRRMRRLKYGVVYPVNALVMASVLVCFATVLYIDLERPDVMNKLKDRAKSMVISATDIQRTDPVSASLLVTEKPRG